MEAFQGLQVVFQVCCRQPGLNWREHLTDGWLVGGRSLSCHRQQHQQMDLTALKGSSRSGRKHHPRLVGQTLVLVVDGKGFDEMVGTVGEEMVVMVRAVEALTGLRLLAQPQMELMEQWAELMAAPE